MRSYARRALILPRRSSTAGSSHDRLHRRSQGGVRGRGLSRSAVAVGPWRPYTRPMKPLSYSGYRFPPEIIQHAIWLYLRFTLSFRDVEELLAERGVDVSHETIRRWVAVFGPVIAKRLRAMRPKPDTTWHLDEMFVSIGGKRMYLWRAVDAEGEVLDCLVQSS